MRRWFRVEHKAGWDGTRFINGRWHLIVVRERWPSGRRYFGAACGPVSLRPTRGGAHLPRSIRRGTPTSGDACPQCIRLRLAWPSSVRRPFVIRRTVCGPECGGWVPRETQAGEPIACGGYHRNKRLFCEADARWAITSTGRGRIRWNDDLATTFFRCTSCARIYRMDPVWFTCERLMGDPPKELVA